MAFEQTEQPMEHEPETAPDAAAVPFDNRPDPAGVDPGHGLASVNEVWLVGRLSEAPLERRMPSGDPLVTFRVIVTRIDPGGNRTVRRRRQRVDALECHAWDPGLQRRMENWNADDVVELRGSLRRRFFRSAQGTQSVTEVEVFRAKLIRRARTG